ncbi:MAG: DUF1553 domain-containing protein [Planctomycetes bacterium]|nr:DUF1553 domain-containing protein [Planctomycetota bacterium]
MRLTAIFAAAAIACALLAFQTFAAAEETDAKPDDKKTEASPSTGNAESALTAAIDREIDKLLARDGITRAPQTNDAEFVRRVYLDLTGMPPKADETVAFLDSTDKDKRNRLIDTLVADKRFAEYVTDQWLNVFTGRARAQDNGDMVLGAWIANEIHAGRGFDQIMYDIITAEGKMSDNPAAAYYGSRRELLTPDVAGETTRQFTGVQIQCAQCHDHPYEDAWKEADFNGVASFFSAMRLRRMGDVRPRQAIIGSNKVKRVDPEVMQKRLKQIDSVEQRLREYEGMRYRAPKYLLGEDLKVENSELWRKAWAKWVIADANTQTQRYLANRFWSFLFGMGILNPVDDFNSINEASHPELLDLLAKDLRDNDYNVQRFYRAVLKTRTWQAASSGATRKEGNVEAWHFARYPVRQLAPEQFFGTLLAISNHAERRRVGVKTNPYARERQQAEREMKADGDAKKEDKADAKGKRYEYDAEALGKLEALIDTMGDDWYVRRAASRRYAAISSDDEMMEAESFTLTIDQALMLMNGEVTTQLSAWGKGSVLDHITTGSSKLEPRIERLFLIVLSRRPDSAETERFAAFIGQGKDERQGWEDALFALLLTSEFSTNH